ncbi:Coiled-coil domain-containing protein 130-like protein [Trichoplax sp. H2]|nr:Coiled-coil domain-containing protein 130-like protein [Trichoplax sp. H2]|eukprot:RDD41482.1 Coiled-coil domain-containing protein 130-like protein [Trichoplax sp. H2]
MADRKAVNKYYPPDWRPEKGSINKYRGSHPLRDRARKLDQGILIIRRFQLFYSMFEQKLSFSLYQRFEMPYNIWCDGCGNHVGMGVRYNAEKKKVGNYYTTPIFNFRMKCHLCENKIEMENDPQNCDYKIVKGASRKNERWEGSEGSISVDGKDEKKKLLSNAMYKLEHDIEDAEAGQQAAPSLDKLERHMDVWKDDFSVNQLLRNKFRKNKAVTKQQALDDDKLKKKFSIDISLKEENDEDKIAASRIRFNKKGDAFENKRKRRFEIKTSSIFNDPKAESFGRKDHQNKGNLFNKKLKGAPDHPKFKSLTSPETKAKFGKAAIGNTAGSLIRRKSSDIMDKCDSCKAENSKTSAADNDSSLEEQNNTLYALVNYETDSDSNSGQEDS